MRASAGRHLLQRCAALVLGAPLGLMAVARIDLVAQTTPSAAESRADGRQWHALYRRLSEPDLDHRRGHRKSRGTIHIKSGIPRRLGLTRDRTLFYIIDATQEIVEIVDIASKTTLDTFKLTEGNKRIRSTPSSRIRRTGTRLS